MLLGSWFASANASPARLPTDPTAATSTTVRRSPVRRETIVPAPISTLARPMPLIGRPPRRRRDRLRRRRSRRQRHPRRPSSRPRCARRRRRSTVRTTPSRRKPPTRIDMTTMPMPSQSARTLTSTVCAAPIGSSVRLRSCSCTVTSPLPTRACTGTCTRVLLCGPAVASVAFATSSRRSSGVAYSTTFTGYGRSLRTQIGIGAPALNRLIGLGGRMPTLSSVVTVAARCASSAVCQPIGVRHPPQAEQLQDLGPLGSGEQRHVVEDRGEPCELAPRLRRGRMPRRRAPRRGRHPRSRRRRDLARPDPPRVRGVTPGACDAVVIAVRSATRERSTSRSTVTTIGSPPVSATANDR